MLAAQTQTTKQPHSVRVKEAVSSAVVRVRDTIFVSACRIANVLFEWALDLFGIVRFKCLLLVASLDPPYLRSPSCPAALHTLSKVEYFKAETCCFVMVSIEISPYWVPVKQHKLSYYDAVPQFMLQKPKLYHVYPQYGN